MQRDKAMRFNIDHHTLYRGLRIHFARKHQFVKIGNFTSTSKICQLGTAATDIKILNFVGARNGLSIHSSYFMLSRLPFGINRAFRDNAPPS